VFIVTTLATMLQ